MWLLGKDKMQKLVPVINSAYYTRWVKYLERLLRFSRDPKYYQDPLNLMGLEIALAQQLGKAQALVVEGKQKRNEAEKAGDSKLVRDLEIGMSQNHQIARVIKVIADGLAWRVLDFDRPFMRIMAEAKKPFGSVNFLSPEYRGVQDKAIAFVGTRGSRVLLNDITHFLRQGDLTEVGKRTIIWELKKLGKTAKSVYTIVKQPPKAGVSKQVKHVIQAQIARDHREIVVGNHTVKILDIPVEYKHNLTEVSHIIAEARKNLFAYREFEDYLAVTCEDNEALVNLSLKTGKELWKDERRNRHPSWPKSDIVLPYSNFDFFHDEQGDFIRNGTPYSVYPFKPHDRMGLISGKIFLKSILNMSEIKRLFIKRGWEIIDVNIDEVLKGIESMKPKLYTGEFLYEHRIDDTAFGVKRGAFNTNIPWVWLTKIATEFIDPQTLIDSVEYVYKISRPSEPKIYVPFLVNERLVWE